MTGQGTPGTGQGTPGEERLPAIGHPAGHPEPERDPDFAAEHEETAVSAEIITGDEPDREPESPRGWSGMQR